MSEVCICCNCLEGKPDHCTDCINSTHDTCFSTRCDAIKEYYKKRNEQLKQELKEAKAEIEDPAKPYARLIQDIVKYRQQLKEAEKQRDTLIDWVRKEILIIDNWTEDELKYITKEFEQILKTNESLDSSNNNTN